MRTAGFCLALGLSAALTPTGVQASVRTRPSADATPGAASLPYLQAAGALPLRFQPVPAPLEALERPTPPPASTSSGSSTETIGTAAQAPGAQAHADTPVPAMPETADKVAASAAAPAVKTPPPIIPDEARPVVRPEDFILYFQLPGSARQSPNMTVVVPAPKAPPTPGTLPPSSATYTQSPR